MAWDKRRFAVQKRQSAPCIKPGQQPEEKRIALALRVIHQDNPCGWEKICSSKNGFDTGIAVGQGQRRKRTIARDCLLRRRKLW